MKYSYEIEFGVTMKQCVLRQGALLQVPHIDITFCFEETDNLFGSGDRIVLSREALKSGFTLLEAEFPVVAYRCPPRLVWDEGFKHSLNLNLDTLLEKAVKTLNASIKAINKSRTSM